MAESVIVVELHVQKRWIEIGRIGRSDLPGSITDRSGGPRAMVLFGWFPADSPEAKPLVVLAQVRLSVTGDLRRLLGAEMLKRLADLTEGPYQRVVISDDPLCVRWSLD